MQKSIPFLALLTLSATSFAYTQQDLLSAQYDYQVASDQLTQAKNNLSNDSKSLKSAQEDRDKALGKYQAAESALTLAKQGKESAEVALKQKTSNFEKSNEKVNQIWDSLNKTN